MASENKNIHWAVVVNDKTQYSLDGVSKDASTSYTLFDASDSQDQILNAVNDSGCLVVFGVNDKQLVSALIDHVVWHWGLAKSASRFRVVMQSGIDGLYAGNPPPELEIWLGEVVQSPELTFDSTGLVSWVSHQPQNDSKTSAEVKAFLSLVDWHRSTAPVAGLDNPVSRESGSELQGLWHSVNGRNAEAHKNFETMKISREETGSADVDYLAGIRQLELACYRGDRDEIEPCLSSLRRLGFKSCYPLRLVTNEWSESSVDKAIVDNLFREILDLNPRYEWARTRWAQWLFEREEFDEAKEVLSVSESPTALAALLNMQGIELVRKGLFQQALDHYTQAQYVMPQHQKSPLLFFNIALCYLKWGRVDQARNFLQLALIKDPEYQKASELLSRIDDVSLSSLKSAS